MRRVRAIELCLMSIESRCNLSASDRLVILEHLELIYQAGFEGGAEIMNFNQPIAQIYKGKEINRFDSIMECARTLGIPVAKARWIVAHNQKHCNYQLITVK